MRLGRLLPLAVVSAALSVVPLVMVGAAQASTSEGRHGSAAERFAARTPVGSDPLVADAGYAGDFPDPSVLLWDGTYYAYSTSTGGLNLPVLTSTDLSTWTVPPADPTTGSVDALPVVASWADWRQRGARRVALTWAPSVAFIGDQFVAAYATTVAASTGGPVNGHKMCISVATASSPLGPFVDDSTAPLLCPADRGVIDPQLYTEAGHVYLLYKTEDSSSGRLTRLWIRELTPDGLQPLPGGSQHLLLQAKAFPSWESGVVENPSLVLVGTRRYLFYSGNGWASTRYAEGYAVCPSLTAQCRRPQVRKVFWVRNHVRKHRHRHRHHKVGRHRVVRMVDAPPLLGTGGAVAGPGGGEPFIDDAGKLRLAYHAWDVERVGYPADPSCQTAPGGCPQRRLHVAELGIGSTGALRVVSRDAPAVRQSTVP